MKIYAFSDIHLESGPFEIDRSALKAADVVVAAGDIGNGTQGVEWLKTLGKPVAYVVGNHEFWAAEPVDYAGTLERIREAAEGTNVHVLERDSLQLGKLRILGCTLWSDYAGWDRRYIEVALSRMRDFHLIGAASWYEGKGAERKLRRLLPGSWANRFLKSKTFNPVIAHELFVKSVAWLRRELARPWEGDTVLLTHHSPTLESLRYACITDWELKGEGPFRLDEREAPIYRAAYASDLDGLLDHSDVALAIHGHLHHRLDFAHRGVRVYCNPRGYYRARTRSESSLTRGTASDAAAAKEILEQQRDAWRGDVFGFERQALVDPADGLVPALMREVNPVVQDLRGELAEARMFVPHLDSPDVVIRLAVREALESRIQALWDGSERILTKIAANLHPRNGSLSRSGLQALTAEFCAGKRPGPLMHSLFKRKGQKESMRAAEVLESYEAVLKGLLDLPSYLERKRLEARRIAGAVQAMLDERRIGARVHGPALADRWRHVPTLAFSVAVPAGADASAIWQLVDKVANPKGPPREMLFVVEEP
jgi:predicted phosphohydrolase